MKSVLLAAVLAIALGSPHAWAIDPYCQNVAGKGLICPQPTTFQLGAILPSSTVAQLPTCNAARKGMLRYVTDATTPTYNAALTGGSNVIVPVHCNGSAWSSH